MAQGAAAISTQLHLLTPCRALLAIASLDGLTEASRQSRVCGGAANEVQCAVFRVLMEVRQTWQAFCLCSHCC